MVVTVLPKGNREAAEAALAKHDEAEDSWKNSSERENAMKEYPGEYIAVRGTKVIEHFKEMDDLFKALRERKSQGKNLLMIVTDHLVPKARSRAEILKHLDILDEMLIHDPVRCELRELQRRANSITPEELHRPFTI
ncbi:MAG: DUF5678 domain-containing protein [Candidatus Micrarchaeales archaeon]|jgi:hypothetical protein